MLAHESVSEETAAVTVFIDERRDRIRKVFRCNGCGQILFTYYGGINLIMPGGVEFDWLDIVGIPKVIVCKNQRTIYRRDGSEVKVKKCKMTYSVVV